MLHDRELTYSVVCPVRALGGPRSAYQLINEGLRAGLETLGVVNVALSTGIGATPPSAGPCFGLPSAGELVVERRKLVGSAQVRMGRSLLQHGSILLVSDQEDLWDGWEGADGLAEGRERNRAVTLREILGEAPEPARLVDAFVKGLEGVLGGVWERGEMGAEEVDRARHLEGTYASPEWTWRR